MSDFLKRLSRDPYAPIDGAYSGYEGGLLEPGNIDLNNRPIVWNNDGTISTVRSMSTNIDGREVLLPTVADGRNLSDDEAVQRFFSTGEHLGMFNTPENATTAAEKIHNDQARQYAFPAKLAADPYAPIDGASVVSVDELGNGYDYRGQLIAPKFEEPQQTWGETALGVATAPARMATALAGSLSPYGQDGWQVPPIIDEGVNALTAVGDAYNYGMDQDEMRNRALGMASFMFAGGGPASALEKSLTQKPVTVRGYHGTRSEFDRFNGPSVYASENPDAASEWAMVANRDGEAPNVLPLDITASNPYYAKSLFPDQAELDRIAAADPDVVFYPPSTQHGTTFDKYPGQVFEARKPGTVRSATTGETLYSNASKEGAIPALLDMGQEARLGQGTSVQRHPVFGHEMPLANNNPLTFEMQLSKIASGESDLPMGGDFYQAARDIQAAEVNDLAAAFGGDTRKAKEFVRLLNDDNPSTAHKFEALQAEATDVPERVYADRFIYDDLARTFNDLEKNPTEYAEIVNRFLADIPTGGKNPASWTSKEQAAMAVMRKAVQEGSRVGVAPDTFSRTIASNYARQFRDPQDAEFMLNELSSSLRQVKKLAANADSRPALLGAGQETEDGYADGGRVGFDPKYLILHDYGGNPDNRDGMFNPYHVLVFPDGSKRYRYPDDPYGRKAPHAFRLNPESVGISYAGDVGSQPTAAAMETLRNEAKAVAEMFPGIEPMGHGEAFQATRGTNRQASRDGRDLEEASWRSNILYGPPAPGQTQVAGAPVPMAKRGLTSFAGLEPSTEPVVRPLPSPARSLAAAEMDADPAVTAEDKPSSFDFTKLASLFAEPEQAQAPQVQFTPIQAFQPQGSPIEASTPYRGTFADGGQVRGLPDQSEPIHAGPLHSTVPGRTDHLPITVAAGSFVLPADIVSSLGEGNTNAGMEAVSKMFPLPPVRRADGGRVPIAAAGGEYVISPETVAAIAGGNIEAGHELLDQFVRRTRAQNIQRLRALPGPEK